MKDISIKDLNKTGSENQAEPVKVIVEKKTTPKDEFLLECNDEEKEIFLKIIEVLTEQCDKYEFEAVTADNLEEFSQIITYIKNGILTLENEGVRVKLRKPLKRPDGTVLTESVKILYERNEAREKTFTKDIKVTKKSTESQREFTLASLAASFENINGAMIGVEATRRIQNNNYRDYMLLLTVFNFFRN